MTSRNHAYSRNTRRAGDWIYPIYIVDGALDAARTSGVDVEVWAALNEILDDLRLQPEIAESVHIALLVQCSAVFIQRSLCQVVESTPREGGGWTDIAAYEPLFRSVNQILDRDRAALATRGVSSHRPLIFLIVDTPPAATDPWQETHRQMVLDADLAALGDELARVFVVPLCLTQKAERAAAAMAYPPDFTSGYAVQDLAHLRNALRLLITYVAMQMRPAADGRSTALLLPSDSDLPPGVYSLSIDLISLTASCDEESAT